MYSEIKDTVYIAVTATLLALVLSLVSVLSTVRMDLADIRNSELYTARNLQIYREFNKYDDKIVYGEDIVEAVRLYYDTDVSIFVDYSGTDVANYYVDKYIVREEPDLVDIDILQNTFTPRHKFESILVYDCVNPRNVTTTMRDKKASSEVTSIVFLYKGLR